MSRTLAVMVVGLTFAVPAAAQTVDEIVARNAAARGGAAAWRAVRSMKMSGRMDVGRGLQVPFVLELKRPRKMRLEFEFDGATAVQTYDGATGFKLAPYRGSAEAEPLSAAELAIASEQGELDGALLDYAAKGNRLRLVGRMPVEGREAFKLELTLKGGAVRQVYVDTETNLEVLMESTRNVKGADKLLATHFRDYRSIRGLVVPHVLESTLEGAPRGHKLTITSIELDVPLADARFGRPVAAATTASVRSARRVGGGGQ